MSISELSLPIHLEKHVIVDAVFELRFDAEVGFSDLVPGGVRELFGEIKKIEKSPIADLPRQIRSQDPNLQYQPVVRMVWDDAILMIGDHSLAIGYGTNYKGWKVFQEHIEKLINCLNDTGLSKMFKNINRYSFRYIDFIPEELSCDLNNPFLMNVSIGNEEIKNAKFRLECEEKEEFGVSLFEFATPVRAEIDDKSAESGTLISVDTVRLFDSVMTWNSFHSDFTDMIEKMHFKNKQLFFKMLSHDLLEKLEPKYE